MPILKTQLPAGTKIYSFSELTATAQDKAIAEVLEREVLGYKRELRGERNKAKIGINQVINNPHRIPALRRQLDLIAKVKRSKEYARGFIEGNLCEFMSDGTYITYSLN